MTPTGRSIDDLRPSVTVSATAVRRAQLRAAARAAHGDALDVAWIRHDTPIGPLLLAATRVGLVLISFDSPDEAVDRLARDVSPGVLEGTGRLDAARHELDEYFAGRRQTFDLSLDWQLSKGFRRETLRELVKVPFGQTVSYKDLAEAAGRPRAFRAVGSAMATNPLPVVVPCHRVLTSAGKLGGYAGGTDVKSHLLELERFGTG